MVFLFVFICFASLSLYSAVDQDPHVKAGRVIAVETAMQHCMTAIGLEDRSDKRVSFDTDIAEMERYMDWLESEKRVPQIVIEKLRNFVLLHAHSAKHPSFVLKKLANVICTDFQGLSQQRAEEFLQDGRGHCLFSGVLQAISSSSLLELFPAEKGSKSTAGFLIYCDGGVLPLSTMCIRLASIPGCEFHLPEGIYSAVFANKMFEDTEEFKEKMKLILEPGKSTFAAPDLKLDQSVDMTNFGDRPFALYPDKLLGPESKKYIVFPAVITKDLVGSYTDGKPEFYGRAGLTPPKSL